MIYIINYLMIVLLILVLARLYYVKSSLSKRLKRFHEVTEKDYLFSIILEINSHIRVVFTTLIWSTLFIVVVPGELLSAICIGIPFFIAIIFDFRELKHHLINK